MEQVISIGKQDYEEIIKENYFYIDKTDFIREWWESGDDVTLITRPRRFGKTLNMSMLKCFFSNQYSGKDYLFKNLSIWKNLKYQNLHGNFPVIYMSFADVKADNYEAKVYTMGEDYVKIEAKDLNSYYEVHTALYEYIKKEVFKI